LFNPHLQERQTLFSRSSKGCYYPEMALFSSLSLPFFVFSVKRGLEKLEANLTPEEIPLQNNRNGDEEPTDYLSGQRESYQTLKGIYSLRWLCWGIVVLSFV